MERKLGLPISYLCDRYTTNMAKSQGGFIDFVVKPLYEVILVFLPDLQNYMPNFEENKKKWANLIP
jgi:3'5'-cyclic nucleotide phosphodiesterase